MAEQHVQLMKGLGLDDATIQKIEGLTPDQLKNWKADDPEALKVFNPGEIVTTVQTGMKNVLTNDPAFLSSIPEDKISPDILKKIEKGQYARFQNELEEVAIKKLGLDKNDLTEDDKKSIKGYVEKLANVYLTKKGNVEGLKEMQTKYSDALQAVEKMKEEHSESLKKELEKVNGANTSKLIKTLAKVELGSLDNIQLAVAPAFVSDTVLAELSAKYSVVLDANDNLVLRQKANPELEVLDSKGGKVTYQQALRELVLEKKLGAEVKPPDPKNPGKKNRVIIEPGKGDEGTGDDLPDYISKKIEQQPDIKPS